MADTKKKKRASLSSFTILLIILVALAVITVIMAACGVEGIEGATLSGVLTAPVFGFQDAIGVCLFVMILGGFLGIVTETGALDAGIERTSLGDDAEETAEDHNEQAHADGVLEAEDRRGEHAGERGALDALDAAGGHDNGNDRKRHQDDQQNSERREARALLLFSISHGSFSLRERRPIREIGRRLDRKKA